jgi:N-acetylneuraminic acid mutarotase
MKKLFILFAFFLAVWAEGAYAQSTDITPSGIIVPRLTTAQRNAIASPGTGQLIYNTNEACFNIFTQTSVWQSLCAVDKLLTNTWTRKADLPGSERKNGVGFSIGSKGYIGFGIAADGLKLSDLWEYDPITDAYTQKADCPDGVRVAGVGFAIGNKGYVGTGFGANSTVIKKDFWEYNPVSNVWTQKADFGGTARTFAVGFAIGNKGYMGTGSDASGFTNDFWEYDPTSNQWTQKANLGTADSTKRNEAFGLNIGSKGYIGGGVFSFTNSNKLVPNDFWEYNPTNNQWTEKANIPNTLIASFPNIRRAMAFSIFDKGFICGGYHGNSAPSDGDLRERNSAQEYNPLSNQWTRIADFGGGIRHSGVAFAIANKGYVGFGVLFQSTPVPAFVKNDLWSYGGFADVTLQGNSFNQANQLVKLDALGNLVISGNIVDEPFIVSNLDLTQNWTNASSLYPFASYYKDKLGMVHLKGRVQNGAGRIFTLPPGYRPGARLVFDVPCSTGLGQVDIFSGGVVGFFLGGNAFVSLDGISFRAEK